MSVPLAFFSAFFIMNLSIKFSFISVIGLPSLSFTVAFSKSLISYTLPHTSGTPLSMSSNVYTASIAVLIEYSVVNIVSRFVSAN